MILRILAVPILVLMLLAGSYTFAATDASAIDDTYKDWTRATAAKDIEWWSTFLDPDALFVPPASPPLATEEAILEYYRRAFADPNFSLDCEQQSVEVAESAEIAWGRGVCRATFTGPDGKKARGTSRWFKVWVKQPDGSWKCRINTWNYE